MRLEETEKLTTATLVEFIGKEIQRYKAEKYALSLDILLIRMGWSLYNRLRDLVSCGEVTEFRGIAVELALDLEIDEMILVIKGVNNENSNTDSETEIRIP